MRNAESKMRNPNIV